MKYCYEDMGDDQFEALVGALCYELLGAGTTEFATGPDGGRDAKFIGTAQLIPSTTAPWTGVTIVQAKHTSAINASYSDASFYSEGSATCLLNKELPRILRLANSNELDNYILFSNRKLTGNKESELRSLIADQSGLSQENVMIVGLENLERWLKKFPNIAEEVNIDPIDSPLNFSPDDLAEIIESIASTLGAARVEELTPPVPRTDHVLKNQLNNMSSDFFGALKSKYIQHTSLIQDFLSAPENGEHLLRYEDAVEEFNQKIIAKRKNYQSFDEVFTYLVDKLIERDSSLRNNKELTRAMVFHMYFYCDIGKSSDDT